MGIFDSLFGKKRIQDKESVENVVPLKKADNEGFMASSIENNFDGSNSNISVESASEIEISNIPDTYIQISISKPIVFSQNIKFSIHSDIVDLVWIADGPFKNYSNLDLNSNFNSESFIFYSFIERNEPSLIYTQLPLESVDDIVAVERPPYYPTYAGLTLQQKWVYWRFLENPYNSDFNIGYVFILYYGLERHLLKGDYEKAFEVILKLRDMHTNSSFQSYSANALILTCLFRQRSDLLSIFMNSLDKVHEFNFSDDLFVLSAYHLNIPLIPSDIMRLAKTFAFTNMNYIKNYSMLFEEVLLSQINNRFNSSSIFISNFISPTEFKSLRKTTVPIFANISIIDKNVTIPLVAESFKFKKEMNELLTVTHNEVKSRLAEMRKKGDPLSKPEVKSKPLEIKMFDRGEETKLLADLNSALNAYEKHFALIPLQNFYYKYRDIDHLCLEKCIEYCLEDIESLDEMQVSYQEINRNSILRRLNDFPELYTKERANKMLSEIDSFNGDIPAFKRLSIIYEKGKKYQKSIDICRLAVTYYSKYHLDPSSVDFSERINKLSQKINNEQKIKERATK